MPRWWPTSCSRRACPGSSPRSSARSRARDRISSSRTRGPASSRSRPTVRSRRRIRPAARSPACGARRSAPLALARRGVEVYAVDTADVIAHERIHHLRTKVGALRWEELPPRVDWLLVDVNLAPQVAVHEIARFAPPLRAHLRGAVITLKLNDWAFVDEL